jgi:hypothetical protein
LRYHEWQCKRGITRSREFERKGLAAHGVNVGLKCGHGTEARAIECVRTRRHWSQYVLDLLRNVQQSVRRHADITKLRFLLYPSNLQPEHADAIREDDAGVVWLGKER